MDISIIIINYNSFDYTNNCIRSIYEASMMVDFEIILVDNNSVEDPGPKVEQLYPKVKYYRLDKNIGFAKGNNLGISYATGKVILLLNNDTIVMKDSVQVCYNLLMENSRIGALSCQLRYPDGKIQHNCQSFPSKKKENIEKFRLHKLLNRKKRSDYMQGFYWNYNQAGNPDWIWGTFFMFRRELLDKLPNKKLDDDYFMYFEDMQWCWDIRNAGYEISYSPKTYITHFGGGSGGDKKHLMDESLKMYQNKTKGKSKK